MQTLEQWQAAVAKDNPKAKIAQSRPRKNKNRQQAAGNRQQAAYQRRINNGINED